MAICFVDIQSFYTKNDGFIVKELCILKGNQRNHFLFKPDVNYNTLDGKDKLTVQRTEDYHGLKFNSGYVDYNLLDEVLKNHLADVDIIYIRGQTKYIFLKNKFNEFDITKPNLINIERFDNSFLWADCPKIEECVPLCLNHVNNRGRCVLNNCLRMRDWIYKCIPM